MSPELEQRYGRAIMPGPDPAQLQITRELMLEYYGTVVGGGNLETGRYSPRDPENEYAQLNIALHPQIESDDARNEFVKGTGRALLLEIISNPDVGLMTNLRSEYIPAITEMFEATGFIEAMEVGRPVILLSDHDNWAAVALMGIGVSAALYESNKPELAKKVALSVGLAAASFDNLLIADTPVDHMEIINVFCDILKSSPDSIAREAIKRSLTSGQINAENDPLKLLNAETMAAFQAILGSGGVIASGVSGTHDREKDRRIEMIEPAPGSAVALFSDEALSNNPLFVPCISSCNPFPDGRQTPAKGTFAYMEGFNFSSDDLTPRERAAEFMTEIQLLKAIDSRRTVRIKNHHSWDKSFEYRDMSPARAHAIHARRGTQAAVHRRLDAHRASREEKSTES